MGSFPSVRAGILALLLLLLCFAILVISADQHPYHEGNYGTAGLPHTDLSGSRSTWDYTNLNDWPQLCRTGSRQSPISFTNVDPSAVVKDAPLKRLQFSSKCFFPKDETQMRIVNEGAVNMVSFERQGRLPEDLSECTIVDPLDRSRVFYFSDLHFHATSEHKFRNLRPDVEMHLSFITDEVKEKKREVLMVAVMLKASTSINSTSVRALRHILVDGSLPRRHAMTTCFLTEDMSITSLLPSRESYLLYDGSETHPPCRENVRWVVMTSPILISRVAVGKLRDAMDELLPNDFHRFGNARPPQALNGRRIYRFDDTSVPQGGRRSEGNLDDAWTRKKKNGMEMMNETGEDDLFRLLEESAEAFGQDDYDNKEQGKVQDKQDAKEATSNDVETEENATVTQTHAPKEVNSDGENDHDATTTTAAPKSTGLADTDAASSSPVMTGEDSSTEPHDKGAKAHNATAPAAHHDDNSSTTATTDASPVEAVPMENASATTDAAPEDSNAELTSTEAPSINTTTSTTADPANSTDSSAAAAPFTSESPTAAPSTAPKNATTSTKKPASRNGKKGHGSPSKNVSGTALGSDSDGNVKERVEATASGVWQRTKNIASRAMSAATVYVKKHPGRAALLLLCNITIFFLICTCIRGWQKPVYVVGIDPSELQPLNPNPAFGQYGGTGAAAVRPANEPRA